MNGKIGMMVVLILQMTTNSSFFCRSESIQEEDDGDDGEIKTSSILSICLSICQACLYFQSSVYNLNMGANLMCDTMT